MSLALRVVEFIPLSKVATIFWLVATLVAPLAGLVRAYQRRSRVWARAGGEGPYVVTRQRSTSTHALGGSSDRGGKCGAGREDSAGWGKGRDVVGRIVSDGSRNRCQARPCHGEGSGAMIDAAFIGSLKVTVMV